MALVQRVAHVGAAVRDLDRALTLYRDILGLDMVKMATLREEGVKAALLRLGDAELELLEPLPGGTLERFLERRGEGLHHVAFTSGDIASALAELKARGVPLVDQKPRSGLNGLVGFLHPNALRGVLVELEQP